MSRRAAFAGLACIIAGLLFAGCGLEGQPFSSATDKTDRTQAKGSEFNPAVVTGDVIARYPKNSPEATALEWWRGVQTRDADAVLDSYSPEARAELPNRFPFALVAAISPAAATSPIRVAEVEAKGDGAATVYVVIDSEDPKMGGPLALPMEKVDDRWEITDPVFLNSLADGYLAVIQAAKKTASDGGQ
ncbi:MAG: hypothetical protein R2718_10195 [Solirubrobacterales bacterium]